MLFASFNNNTTGVNSGRGTAYPLVHMSAPLCCVCDSCSSIFSSTPRVVYIIVCHFVLFPLAIVLSVCRIKASDYHFVLYLQTFLACNMFGLNVK